MSIVPASLSGSHRVIIAGLVAGVATIALAGTFLVAPQRGGETAEPVAPIVDGLVDPLPVPVVFAPIPDVAPPQSASPASSASPGPAEEAPARPAATPRKKRARHRARAADFLPVMSFGGY